MDSGARPVVRAASLGGAVGAAGVGGLVWLMVSMERASGAPGPGVEMLVRGIPWFAGIGAVVGAIVGVYLNALLTISRDRISLVSVPTLTAEPPQSSQGAGIEEVQSTPEPWTARPSQVVVVAGLLKGTFVGVLGWLPIALLSRLLPNELALVGGRLAVAVFALVVLGFTARGYERFLFSRVEVHADSIVIRTKPFGGISKTIQLGDVEGVEVTVPFLGRLARYGSVLIRVKGESPPVAIRDTAGIEGWLRLARSGFGEQE